MLLKIALILLRNSKLPFLQLSCLYMDQEMKQAHLTARLCGSLYLRGPPISEVQSEQSPP